MADTTPPVDRDPREALIPLQPGQRIAVQCPWHAHSMGRQVRHGGEGCPFQPSAPSQPPQPDPVSDVPGHYEAPLVDGGQGRSGGSIYELACQGVFALALIAAIVTAIAVIYAAVRV